MVFLNDQAGTDVADRDDQLRMAGGALNQFVDLVLLPGGDFGRSRTETVDGTEWGCWLPDRYMK